MRCFASIALALIWPLSATAFGPDNAYPDVQNETPLTESQLRSAFEGQTHQGSYNFLNRNITSFAFTETTAKDGQIRHVQEDIVDTGQWKISGEIICYDYDEPDLHQACFKIYARGNCYYHYQVSVEGHSQYGFTARSVIKGQTPDCEPSLV